MTNYSHIASRLFNRPHMVEPEYARVLIGALAERLDIQSLAAPDGTILSGSDLRNHARGHSGSRPTLFETIEGIAVIPVEGTLVHRFGHLDPYSGMTGYDGVQAKIDSAVDDPNVRGILLDINSPGGEVSGCFDLADVVFEARQRKPVWALADELCCSAAFALGSAASRIIVPRTAQIGSVGVLTAHVDQSQLLEDAGLDVTLIFSGDHKVDGNPYEPLPDDVRVHVQSEIDSLRSMFANLVARNRGISVEAVVDTQARVFAAREAVDVGFADDVMAARDVIPAFEEFLSTERPAGMSASTREVPRMAILGIGRKAKKDDKEIEEHDHEEESAQEEEEEVEAQGEATSGEPESSDEPEDEPDTPPRNEKDKAADAVGVVAACNKAGVPALAEKFLKDGLTAEQVEDRLATSDRIRDLCKAARCEGRAEKYIEGGLSVEEVRAELFDVLAARDSQEINHHPGVNAGKKQPEINLGRIYGRLNGHQ